MKLSFNAKVGAFAECHITTFLCDINAPVGGV